MDLGFTSITQLPSEGLGQLERLSLASCSNLPSAVLGTFLANLPPTLRRIDLSRLEQVSYAHLSAMRVCQDGAFTALREVKVVGIDHLTRLDIRRLKGHWESQRRACITEVGVLVEPIPVRRVWGEPHTPLLGLSTSTPRTPSPLLRGTPDSDRSSPSPSPVTPAEAITHPIIADGATLSVSPSQWTGKDKLPLHPFLPSRLTYGLLPSPPPQTPEPAVVPRPPPKAAPVDDPLSINIVHSAILESEDEAGYRQFIGEVVGGTVNAGLGLDIVHPGYVEIDHGQ